MSPFAQEELRLLLSRRVGLDIGGTLAKLAFIQPLEDRHLAADCDSVTRPIRFAVDGKKYICQFRFFATREAHKLIKFIRDQKLLEGRSSLHVSGGGAHKFEELLRTELGVEVIKCDEMRSVMMGVTFVLGFKGSSYSYDLRSQSRREESKPCKPCYPFLVVNIGSGVSILKATSKDHFERVSGTCIGGGTVLGLAKLCCGVDSFDEAVALSERGCDALDLTVGDLVGDSAGSRTLPPDALASSFGRVYVEEKASVLPEVYKEDVARSAIRMVSYNLGYLAFLLAEIHQVRKIYFSGKYIHNHSFTMRTITQAVVVCSMYSINSKERYADGWQSTSEFEDRTEDLMHRSFEHLVSDLQRRKDSGRHKALFLLHDGYTGAIGCMLAR